MGMIPSTDRGRRERSISGAGKCIMRNREKCRYRQGKVPFGSKEISKVGEYFSDAHKIADDNAQERLGKKMKRRRGFSRKTQGQDKWEDKDKGRNTHKM